jgi:hypothetical protein
MTAIATTTAEVEAILDWPDAAAEPLDLDEEKVFASIALGRRLTALGGTIEDQLVSNPCDISRVIDLMSIYSELGEHYTLGKVSSAAIYTWLVFKLDPLACAADDAERISGILRNTVDRLIEVVNGVEREAEAVFE